MGFKDITYTPEKIARLLNLAYTCRFHKFLLSLIMDERFSASANAFIASEMAYVSGAEASEGEYYRDLAKSYYFLAYAIESNDLNLVTRLLMRGAVQRVDIFRYSAYESSRQPHYALAYNKNKTMLNLLLKGDAYHGKYFVEIPFNDWISGKLSSMTIEEFRFLMSLENF